MSCIADWEIDRLESSSILHEKAAVGCHFYYFLCFRKFQVSWWSKIVFVFFIRSFDSYTKLHRWNGLWWGSWSSLDGIKGFWYRDCIISFVVRWWSNAGIFATPSIGSIGVAPDKFWGFGFVSWQCSSAPKGNIWVGRMLCKPLTGRRRQLNSSRIHVLLNIRTQGRLHTLQLWFLLSNPRKDYSRNRVGDSVSPWGKPCRWKKKFL